MLCWKQKRIASSSWPFEVYRKQQLKEDELFLRNWDTGAVKGNVKKIFKHSSRA